ncbi:MAG: protein kinase [Phycisphaerales bacterium]|nr:protein kinase [Phycisphaerales bacterium]
MADPPSEQPQPPPAQTLGDFRLLQRIGQGSQGAVWLAEDSLGRRVAVKKLSTLSHPSHLNREETALRLYQGLSEERHLLRVLHVGRSDCGLFYSMELADSEDTGDGSAPVPMSLSQLLCKRGSLGGDDSKRIISDVLDGVAALHARGLLHRDIKPSNILRVGGIWKLGDIGLITEDRTEVTALGTVEFMPPNGAIDRSSDLYACGRVLYCLLTGLPARSFPTLPKSLLADTSPEVRALNAAVNRACALDPTQRFQSAAEFKAALAESRRTWSSRTKWSVFLAGCSLIALAGWGIHGLQQTPFSTVGKSASWLPLFNGSDIAGWSKPEPYHGTWFVENGTIRCNRDAEYKLLRLDQNLGPGTLRVVASPDHEHARFGIRYACDQPGGGPLFMLMGDKYTWLRGHKDAYPPDQPGNWFSFPGPIPKPGEEVVLEVELGPTRHQLRANGQLLYVLPPMDKGGPMMLHVWADDSASFRSVEYQPAVGK